MKWPLLLFLKPVLLFLVEYGCVGKDLAFLWCYQRRDSRPFFIVEVGKLKKKQPGNHWSSHRGKALMNVERFDLWWRQDMGSWCSPSWVLTFQEKPKLHTWRLAGPFAPQSIRYSSAAEPPQTLHSLLWQPESSSSSSSSINALSNETFVNVTDLKCLSDSFKKLSYDPVCCESEVLVSLLSENAIRKQTAECWLAQNSPTMKTDMLGLFLSTMSLHLICCNLNN